MSRRDVEVILLCEDKAQFNFARRALIELGFDKGNIRRKTSTSGDAKRRVLDNYATEVEANRKRRKTVRNTMLLVMIDADDDEHDVCERKLETLARRDKRDPIAHWIPKRCIETWILNLGANESIPENDEENRNGLKNRLERIGGERPNVRKQAAAAFVEFIHNQCPEGEYSHLPALHAACVETRERLLRR